MLRLIAFFGIFCSFYAWAAPELSDRIRIEKVHGPKEVKVVRGAGRKEESATVGDMLFVGDTVITLTAQIVELSAYDGSSWKIAPGSQLKLESRKPDQKSLFFWTFHLLSGGMWGTVPKEPIAKDSFRLNVKTKFASMGIRGTEYLLAGDETLSTLEVLEGTVWWGKSVDFSEGSYKEVRAGQHAEMGADGKFVVNSSIGDKNALMAKYGFVPMVEEIEPKNRFTLEECTVLGKGWKSSDGSRRGECF